MARQFSNRNKLTIAKATTTSEAATATSDVVDTAGYKGVAFLVSIGTANATNTITIQQCDSTDGTFADLASTKVSSGTNINNLAVDVCRPTKRYVKCVVARGAATAICPIWAILYDKNEPVGDSSVAAKLAHEFYYAPAEGTA